MEENQNNLLNPNNTVSQSNSKTSVNKTLVIIFIILVILLGGLGYFLFIRKNDSEANTQKQEESINYKVLDYQCKEKYCNDEDFENIKQLLKTEDIVKEIYGGEDYKNHVVILENVTNGNKYLYLVDEDKYYFKNDNYYEISLINEEYENDGKRDREIYDYNYAIVYQKTDNNQGYRFANTKIFSFKNEKYVFEIDKYIDSHNGLSCIKYENQRFYKLNSGTLYDGNFNKIIEVAYGFALDTKYVFGEIIENSEYKFFKYNIDDKKFEYSNIRFNHSDNSNYAWTYNYFVQYNNDEFEIYDFDGNIIFKTDEKTNLKNIKIQEYNMPFIPELYYSKVENKIKLIIRPDVCGDESCSQHFGYSYYEYDIESKEIMYKFFDNNIPDDIQKNLYSGYAKF